MVQPPSPNNKHTLRAGLIVGAKRRWVLIGGGLVGLIALATITPTLFSPAAPEIQLAATPTVVIALPTHLPATRITRSTIPTTISAPIATPALPETLGEARVIKVVDGDMLEVEVDGRTAVVKLDGIRVPGLSPSMCFGREASEYTQAMLTTWGNVYGLSVVFPMMTAQAGCCATCG